MSGGAFLLRSQAMKVFGHRLSTQQTPSGAPTRRKSPPTSAPCFCVAPLLQKPPIRSAAPENAPAAPLKIRPQRKERPRGRAARASRQPTHVYDAFFLPPSWVVQKT